jgi:hypothetical protein
MVVHIVSFKYKADASAAARADHRAKLKGIADIEGILDFKVGEDFVRSPRSYDTGLVVLFRDRAALERYATHPRHVPVAQFGRDLSETIVAVDFDA